MANRQDQISYAEVSRQMILELQRDTCEMKKDIVEIRNIYINRLPTWATIGFTFCGILIGALVGVIAS